MTGTCFPVAFLAPAVASSLLLISGCFTEGTRDPLDGGVTDIADTGTPDAGKPDSETSCVPGVEICNGLDDDCDGVGDADDPAAQTHCEQVAPHSTPFCAEVTDKWLCVPGAVCDEGFENCDGDPTNGCEPLCACSGECPEAAM